MEIQLIMNLIAYDVLTILILTLFTCKNYTRLSLNVRSCFFMPKPKKGSKNLCLTQSEKLNSGTISKAVFSIVYIMRG